jgi:sugar transferase EpsL
MKFEMKNLIKRAFDLLIAMTLLAILSPLILIISCLILINMGKPIFFIQKRPGKNGIIFEIIKFRTMTDNKDLNESERINHLGRLLRATSIDELPEIINVIRGDMSLVGPRPLLVEYLPLYSQDQLRRHEVRPGITGWAQINGRNAISWEDKFDLDLWYINNYSFWIDLKILIITFVKVLKLKNINEKEGLSMAKFKGDRN